MLPGSRWAGRAPQRCCLWRAEALRLTFRAAAVDEFDDVVDVDVAAAAAAAAAADADAAAVETAANAAAVAVDWTLEPAVVPAVSDVAVEAGAAAVVHDLSMPPFVVAKPEPYRATLRMYGQANQSTATSTVPAN